MTDEPLVVLWKRGKWAEDWALKRKSAPLGPRNTWSNIAYAVVGSLIAYFDPTDSGAAMGVAMWLLATGSALYHAQKTIFANRFDWLGMYAVFAGLTSHAYFSDAAWLMLAGGALLGWMYAKWLAWVSVDWHMGVLLLASAIPPFLHGQRALVVASMLVFLSAYGVWHLDRAKSAWVGLWGHAFWHVATAAAIGLMYWAQV